MKVFEIEIIYKMFDYIPENFPFELKLKILRNKSIVEREYLLIESLRKICSDEEIKHYLLSDFINLNELTLINILEIPDDINDCSKEFLDGIFLITN